jgi:hypothetical protein
MNAHAKPRPRRRARVQTTGSRRFAVLIAVPAAMIVAGLYGGNVLQPVSSPESPGELGADAPSPTQATPTPTDPATSSVGPPPDRVGSAGRSATRGPTFKILKAPRLKEKVVIPAGFVRLPVGSQQPTTFTVTSFNVLGASHTAGGGDRRSFGSGAARMRTTVGLFGYHDISVAGLQEFQASQLASFNALTGGSWGVYPGMALGNQPVQNSIVWRKSEWTLVQAQSTPIPYFRARVPMPQVLLRHNATGREVWFANFHNPADKYGPAQGARNEATAIEASLVRNFVAGGRPVIVTGDMNERESFYCRISAAAPVHGANGAYRSGTSCRNAARTAVDWILGSTTVQFSNYQLDESTVSRRISDHYMIRADVTLDPLGDNAACIPAPKDEDFIWCPPGG